MKAVQEVTDGAIHQPPIAKPTGHFHKPHLFDPSVARSFLGFLDATIPWLTPVSPGLFGPFSSSSRLRRACGLQPWVPVAVSLPYKSQLPRSF